MPNPSTLQYDEEIVFTSEIKVELIDTCGDDRRIVGAARALDPLELAARYREVPPEDDLGLLRYLTKHRHGSPWEHGLLTVHAHAPAMVWWEWTRHRAGVPLDTELSFNLESGRYRELRPVFWVPSPSRKFLKAEGFKAARPRFAVADDVTYTGVVEDLKAAHREAWRRYQSILARGVGAEVARSVLGFGVYYSGWVTFNPRSCLHFLSLRTHEPSAQYVSYPQAEIEEAARQVERLFGEKWPLGLQAFNECGRVAP